MSIARAVSAAATAYLFVLTRASECLSSGEGCDELESMKVSMLQKKQGRETISALEARKAEILNELSDLENQLAALDERTVTENGEEEQAEGHSESQSEALEGEVQGPDDRSYDCSQYKRRRRVSSCACRRRNGAISGTGRYGCYKDRMTVQVNRGPVPFDESFSLLKNGWLFPCHDHYVPSDEGTNVGETKGKGSALACARQCRSLGRSGRSCNAFAYCSYGDTNAGKAHTECHMKSLPSLFATQGKCNRPVRADGCEWVQMDPSDQDPNRRRDPSLR